MIRGARALVAGALVVSCSSFETTKSGDGVSDAATPTGDAGRYNPSGSIECDREQCKPPAFCCIRQNEPNSCETDVARCSGEEEVARLRCASGSACAPGNKCCLRISSYVVQSAECEPVCTTDVGSSGVFQLCGEGESFGVCRAECVPLEPLIEGQTRPRLNLSVCK